MIQLKELLRQKMEIKIKYMLNEWYVIIVKHITENYLKLCFLINSMTLK